MQRLATVPKSNPLSARKKLNDLSKCHVTCGETITLMASEHIQLPASADRTQSVQFYFYHGCNVILHLRIRFSLILHPKIIERYLFPFYQFRHLCNDISWLQLHKATTVKFFINWSNWTDLSQVHNFRRFKKWNFNASFIITRGYGYNMSPL